MQNDELEGYVTRDNMLLGAVIHALAERLTSGRWCSGCTKGLLNELAVFIDCEADDTLPHSHHNPIGGAPSN